MPTSPNPPTTKPVAVIHDGNGTWFGASDLFVSLLDPTALAELATGDTTVLLDADCLVESVGELLSHFIDPGAEAEWT